MSGEPKTEHETLLKRVPVIVRSWDGPNSRIGLEMDLGQMPWGPFDALGKRLTLLLPASEEAESHGPSSESQVERALRHVEHAADRCAEFAQMANGNQDLWRRSLETWEWIRKYLTTLWVDTEVEGDGLALDLSTGPEEGGDREEVQRVPPLPAAAATLAVAAKALRATPLATWRESLDPLGSDAPTREEAIQTLLGVARILGGSNAEDTPVPRDASPPEPEPLKESAQPSSGSEDVSEDPDPDQVAFDFARGYDEGYQMGRRVGLALGARKGNRPGRPTS